MTAQNTNSSPSSLPPHNTIEIDPLTLNTATKRAYVLFFVIKPHHPSNPTNTPPPHKFILKKKKPRRKGGPSGSLNRFTQKKKGVTYPTLPPNTERDPANIMHWFWSFSYATKTKNGKWRTRTKTIPRSLVPTIASAISAGVPVCQILEIINTASPLTKAFTHKHHSKAS